MTFEVGNESEMFLLPNGRVISLRKQNAIIEETQLVIVIAKDCTDGKNLKQYLKTTQEDLFKYNVLLDGLTRSSKNLNIQVEELKEKQVEFSR